MIRLCFFRRRPSMARPICRGAHSARHCRAPARRRPPCSRRSVFGPRSDSLSRDLSCIVTEPLSLHCHCLHFFGIQSQCTLDLLLTNRLRSISPVRSNRRIRMSTMRCLLKRYGGGGGVLAPSDAVAAAAHALNRFGASYSLNCFGTYRESIASSGSGTGSSTA
jgi:hypothetical protein